MAQFPLLYGYLKTYEKEDKTKQISVPRSKTTTCVKNTKDKIISSNFI